MQDEFCQIITSAPEVTRRSLPVDAVLSPFPTDGFFLIIEGAVAVEFLVEDHGPTTLEVLGPGDCVPYWPRPSGGSVPFELRVMVPTSVATVPLQAFARVMQSVPSLAGHFGARFARQHVALLDRLAETAQRSSLRRVSAAIVSLAHKLGQACPLAGGTRIPLPQAEVAKVANRTRQTTNEILTQLQEAGLIRVERAMVCVLDLGGVDAVAGGAPPGRRWEQAASCKLVRPDKPLTCYPLRRASPPR